MCLYYLNMYNLIGYLMYEVFNNIIGVFFLNILMYTSHFLFLWAFKVLQYHRQYRTKNPKKYQFLTFLLQKLLCFMKIHFLPVKLVNFFCVLLIKKFFFFNCSMVTSIFKKSIILFCFFLQLNIKE